MPVVYVAGAMRSGTTIVGQAVAASPDAVLVGEIKPTLLEPERHTRCDCGRDRDTCPFWSTLPPVDAGLSAAARSSWSLRALPRLLVHVVTGRPVRGGDALVVDHLRGVARAAGGRVVVDTSKTPVGVLLWRLAGQPVHLVPCLRTPREVAAAQARPTSQTGLVRVRPSMTWAVWTVYQVLTAVVAPLAAGVTPVGYRRLRRAPAAVVGRIWRRAGLRPAPPLDDGDGAADPAEFPLGESHVLAANPRRVTSGRLRISPRPGRR